MAAQHVVVRLPADFAGTPIRRKASSQSGFFALPFVAGARCRDLSAPNWTVPARGGFQGGYRTGEAMALTLLKHMRTAESTRNDWLTLIADSFMGRLQEEGHAQQRVLPIPDRSHSYMSLRGQYAGFFNTLSTWLAQSAHQSGASLDTTTEQDLIARANAGLCDHLAGE